MAAEFASQGGVFRRDQKNQGACANAAHGEPLVVYAERRMMRDNMSLIEEIVRGASGEDMPLASLLRKCQVLVSRLGSKPA